MKAISFLRSKLGKQATPVRLITFGAKAKEKAERHALKIGGVTIPVKQVHRLFDVSFPEPLGPGFVVSMRHPKYNWVADVSFLYAEIE
ncbi:MAG: hypothetical protein IIA60_09425 [Candidatus Marinimicrobia bacterium]|nr:hypothetical protein [Candidatus Neomarinimicrobiota bacterium]